jgi:hypothetical protein
MGLLLILSRIPGKSGCKRPKKIEIELFIKYVLQRIEKS